MDLQRRCLKRSRQETRGGNPITPLKILKTRKKRRKRSSSLRMMMRNLKVAMMSKEVSMRRRRKRKRKEEDLESDKVEEENGYEERAKRTPKPKLCHEGAC
jgi:hypothetical protein